MINSSWFHWKVLLQNANAVSSGSIISQLGCYDGQFVNDYDYDDNGDDDGDYDYDDNDDDDGEKDDNPVYLTILGWDVSQGGSEEKDLSCNNKGHTVLMMMMIEEKIDHTQDDEKDGCLEDENEAKNNEVMMILFPNAVWCFITNPLKSTNTGVVWRIMN